MSEAIKENPWLDAIRKNWVLIAFLTGLVIQWTNTNYRLSALETNTQKVEASAEKNKEDIAKLQGDFNVAIVEIKANYLFIREKLEKLDNAK